ncbi:MAG: L,D-transpeptidase family protein [Verrucomicrobia bacterium]|nr:L,D-transpeptidase family protein [Verrucomicrobiota bacterium]
MRIRWFSIILVASCIAACTNGEKSRLANPNTAYLPSTGNVEANSADSGSGYDPISYWDGDGVQGPPSIKIYLKEQRAYFYKADVLVGESQVSAGREGHNTPIGNYKIIQKDKDHASSLYGDYVDANGNVIQKDVELGKDPKPPGAMFKGAPMPYFMRIVGGVGMHEGYLPGYPASHGCIRMPGKMAETFFNNVDLGTPVQIVD